MSRLRDLATRLEGLLQGEPLRVIVYGAAVAMWLGSRVALAAGVQVDVPTLDAALTAATAAAATLTEICRSIVYSPATVERMQRAKRW